MKSIPQKFERLRRRAEELRQSAEKVAPRLAQARESIGIATMQVQKLRSDVLTSVATLRAENDTQLLSSLHEVSAAKSILEQAGCALERVELDLGPVRRLLVHLRREGNVTAHEIRTLQAAQAAAPTARALLDAVAKAHELATGVQLEGMEVSTIVVEIGLVPTVRVGWQAPAVKEAEIEKETTPPAPVNPLPVEPQELLSSHRPRVSDEAATMPEHRAMPAASAAPVTANADAVECSSPPALTTVSVGAKANLAGPAAWSASALDRFKKMPELRR